MLVGAVLVAGLGTFLVGAGGWRLEYQRPLPESLPLIHRDRGRWTWIHVWMVAGVFVTSAGLAGLAVLPDGLAPRILATMAAAV